jgi:PAS domain S-box-containing protein
MIESINPSSERMFGYRAEDLVGKHLMMLFRDSTLFSVSNAQDCRNFMEQIFQKSLNRVGEFDALKQIGEHFPIEISLSELETTEGKRYLANILDVSERREVERLKKEFVSTVSHELRTPLTSIRGSLTLLSVGALGSLPDQAKKVVGIAERNTIRLITLINDILDIEKLESGKLDMVFDTVSLSNVMERSAEAVKAFAEQNGIRLEFQPTNATVNADGDRLVQVMVNLISNAVKFSPKGGAVTIAVSEIPNWVEVKVIDRGRGIPAKFKNALFQRFQQVEASDSKKKGGTGLGLAICKGIIEAHSGNIGVESEEGKGSVFWFRVPPASQRIQTGNAPQPLAVPASAQPMLVPVGMAQPHGAQQPQYMHTPGHLPQSGVPPQSVAPQPPYMQTTSGLPASGTPAQPGPLQPGMPQQQQYQYGISPAQQPGMPPQPYGNPGQGMPPSMAQPPQTRPPQVPPQQGLAGQQLPQPGMRSNGSPAVDPSFGGTPQPGMPPGLTPQQIQQQQQQLPHQATTNPLASKEEKLVS